MLATKRRSNRLSDLRNREKGKRIFILANGPSINDLDLRVLRDEVVIGMNASTLLEERFDFVSEYYVVSDKRFLLSEEKRMWATNKLHLDTLRVVRKDLAPYDDGSLINNTYYVFPLARDGFSRDLRHGFYYGCTTTMLALQLAYHLGAREIYLLGCDLRYPEESPRFYAESKPQLEDAFASVQLSNILNAAIDFEKTGGIVKNCSERSFLRAYLPFQNFPELFGKCG